MQIEDFTAEAARHGYTTAVWQDRQYTIDEINALLAGQELSGWFVSWRGLHASVPGLAQTYHTKPTAEQVSRAGGAGTMSVGSSREYDGGWTTTWVLTPEVIFPIGLHPAGDTRATAGARITAARDACRDRALRRTEYEALCGDMGVEPRSDKDHATGRPRPGTGSDHNADPMALDRVGGILDVARMRALPARPSATQVPVAQLGPLTPGLTAGGDRVADLLGLPAPTEATMRGECHYCGLPLVDGACRECDPW